MCKKNRNNQYFFRLFTFVLTLQRSSAKSTCFDALFFHSFYNILGYRGGESVKDFFLNNIIQATYA